LSGPAVLFCADRRHRKQNFSTSENRWKKINKKSVVVEFIKALKIGLRLSMQPDISVKSLVECEIFQIIYPFRPIDCSVRYDQPSRCSDIFCQGSFLP